MPEEWNPEKALQAVELEKEVHPEESEVELAERLMSEAALTIINEPRYQAAIRLQEFIERTKEE
jgi:hypothetical protein